MNLPFAPNAYALFGWDITWNQLSDQQVWVLEQRAQGLSVDLICKSWKTKFATQVQLGHSAYEHCIISTALGYFWEQTLMTGKRSYLCESDVCALETILKNSVTEQEYLETDQVQVQAYELKKSRLATAITILEELNHPKLVTHIITNIKPPSRSWVNVITEKINAKLLKPSYIELDRYIFGNTEVITNYFNDHGQLLASFHPSLIFGADETMLEPKVSKKLCVPADVELIIKNGIPNMPHITALCSHNAAGDAVPLFIVLKELRNLPLEFQEWNRTGKAWFASSPSGFITRDLFLQWSIHFINWLSSFRLTLDPSIRNAKALLIMDGHRSRENPLALMLFASNNIEILILPSHVTHILQMFDVCLASPMKAKFATLFRRQLHLNVANNTHRSSLANIRHAAVHAIITSWSAVCTLDNCVSAARVTGTHPVSMETVLANAYVRKVEGALAELYNRRKANLEVHWTIGSKNITEPENFLKVVDIVQESANHSYLCSATFPSYVCRDEYDYYTKNAKLIITWSKNNCHLFSKPPPYFCVGREPFLFSEQ